MKEYNAKGNEFYIDECNRRKRYLEGRIHRLENQILPDNELYKFLKLEKDKLDYLRPGNDVDMEYREKQSIEFAEKIEKLNSKIKIKFKGYSIWNAIDLLNDNKLSIDEKDDIISAVHEAIEEQEPSEPGGCIFAFKSIKNSRNKVDVHELYGIITTPENIEDIKSIEKCKNMSGKNVYTFEKFYRKMHKEAKKEERFNKIADFIGKNKILMKVPFIKEFVNNHKTQEQDTIDTNFQREELMNRLKVEDKGKKSNDFDCKSKISEKENESMR